MKIPENIMTVARVFLPLVVIIILFVVVGQFGFKKITDIRAQVDSALTDQKTLTQKLDILTNLKNTGEASSNIVVAALPDSNPSLLVVSQLRILAGTNGLAIGELKAGSAAADGTGLSNVNISFNAIGTRKQIETFIGKINTIAPITKVDKVKITDSPSGSSVGNITVKSFWAAFPTKIPAVSQAIFDLTTAEQETLKGLKALSQPIFTQVPAGQGGKVDPFSL